MDDRLRAWTDFGLMNNWNEQDRDAEYRHQLMEKCQSKHHVKKRVTLRSCYDRFECPTCAFSYEVDSSD